MKRKRWTPESPHQALRLALASASLLTLTAAPSLAAGSPEATPSTSGVYITILSPNPGTALTGAKHVEITAYYESSFGVSSVDLFIDGKRMATQQLAKPEGRGEISFVVDPTTLKAGQHTIVVRATATDAEVASARTSLSLPDFITADAGGANVYQSTAGAPDAAGTSNELAAPKIDVATPAPDATVSGIVEIKVNASDTSGKAPYVSLFIDHSFKTLRNFAPYTFDWDTTRLSNGPHTIEVWGYNDAQQVGHAAPVHVNVNNPSGRTFERTDLSDSVAPKIDNRATRRSNGTRAARGLQHASTATTASATRKTKTAVKPAVAARRAAAIQADLISSTHASRPLIAHAVKSAMATLLAKADHLASIGADATSLGSDSVDETLIAPVVSEHSTAEVVAKANADAAATNQFDVTSATVHRADAAKVPHLHAAHASRNGGPLIATSGDAGQPDAKMSTRLDGIAPSYNDDLDKSDVSVQTVVPQFVQPSTNIQRVRITGISSTATVAPGAFAHRIAARTPSKITKMASASIDVENPVTRGNEAGAPHVNISALTVHARTAPSTMGAISHHTVTLSHLTPREMGNLNGEFQIVMDNQRLELHQPLQDRGTVLFAPMRQIIENEGGTLDWDQAKRQVRAVTSSREVVLTIGSKRAVVNNQVIALSGAPYLYNSRTMLPLDFFPTAMNSKVSYDAATGHLVIESK